MRKRTQQHRSYPGSTSGKERKVTVQEASTLLPFLLETLKEQSRSSVKAMLGHGQISVNQRVTRQFDTELRPGDTVGINYGRGKVEFKNPLLRIVWEDDDLIVVNKKEGLLSISTERVKQRTAYHLLNEYVKQSDPHNRIYILHRLDRDTSGLMMFAKSPQIKEQLQSNWSQAITMRTYVAVVEGKPEKDTDLIVSNLTENRKMQVYVAPQGDGKTAITRYKVLQSNAKYSLLELELETGRKNQIRVQMQSIGHPVAGDSKYGAETNPARRLMLHARKLYFIHPRTGEEMRFETRIPDAFLSTTKSIADKK